jgi:hypothetical protein
MGFGMGLGAFAQGLAGGLALGESIQRSSEERALKSEIAAATEEVKTQFGDKFGSDEATAALNSRISTIYTKSGRLDDARKAGALSDASRARHEESALKAGLKTASDEAKAKFGDGDGGLTDEGVAYMTKRSAAAFMAAGQPEKAREFLKWAEESDTKANTKRFANGLRQIDMGDFDGFDKTLGKLGGAKGYGPEVGIGFARGDDGKIITNRGPDGETYYRMKITPPGATEPVLQDVPKSRMKDAYARWFNPQAAFEAEQAAGASKSKREADIKDYETKKGIDARAADPQRVAKERGEAIDNLRKRDFSGKTFDDLADPQKEAEISKELGLRRGAAQTGGLMSGAPGLGGGTSRAVVMDRATGQPVKQPQAAGPAPNATTAPAGLPPAYPTSRQTSGTAPPSRPEDEIASLQSEAASLDQQIADTQARSRNADAAEVLLQPLRAKRADVDSRLRAVQESRSITPSATVARPDVAQKSGELDKISQQLGEIQNRPGGAAAYRDTVDALQQRKAALLDEQNADRRTWR